MRRAAAAAWLRRQAQTRIVNYQLVFQFRGDSTELLDNINALETELIDSLGERGRVDGHDIKSGKVNLFINTQDPASAFRRSKPSLERRELLNTVTVAHRLEGGAKFTVLWPLKSRRRFGLA